jgi:hypothetical protein
MKHLPPTRKNAPLKRAHVEVLVSTRKLLDECKNDTELWCARLSLELIRDGSLLMPPVRCAIFGQKIFVISGLPKRDEVWAIAHEYAHYIFHAATTAYKTLDRFRINRDESEANAFADLMVERI